MVEQIYFPTNSVQRFHLNPFLARTCCLLVLLLDLQLVKIINRHKGTFGGSDRNTVYLIVVMVLRYIVLTIKLHASNECILHNDVSEYV